MKVSKQQEHAGVPQVRELIMVPVRQEVVLRVVELICHFPEKIGQFVWLPGSKRANMLCSGWGKKKT